MANAWDVLTIFDICPNPYDCRFVGKPLSGGEDVCAQGHQHIDSNDQYRGLEQKPVMVHAGRSSSAARADRTDADMQRFHAENEFFRRMQLIADRGRTWEWQAQAGELEELAYTSRQVQHPVGP
eukprot:1453203-Amphidinium_carterae.1